MQGFRTALLAVGASLCFVAPSSAGLYNTVPNEQLSGPLQLAQFQRVYGYYMRLYNPISPERALYADWIARLERKEKEPDGLSDEDRINLSAFYIRLRQPEKAVGVLAPLDTPERRNFLVAANLSMAHFLSKRMERAIDYAEQALKAWPAEWSGWSRLQLSWFYRVEGQYLNLLRLRAREELAQPGKTGQTLDNLFGGVRFVGPSGQYEAGNLDPRQYARLPADHVQVVQQLLLWIPDDPQLTWLFAEVLNANSAIVEGADLMSNLSFNLGYRPKELTEHLRVLQDARAPSVAWMTRVVANDEQYRLLWMVMPRNAAPGAVPIGNEVVNWGITSGMMRTHRPEEPPAPKGPTTPTTATDTPKWMPDVRHVVVSFLAGVAITLLASMQLREMRRRRQATAAAAKE
jgi:hypothetical protein